MRIKNRDRREIIADIVRSAAEETKKSPDEKGGFKTYIMNGAHLSGEQYLYFDAAVEAGLLEKVDEKRYRPSPKGIEYLEGLKKPPFADVEKAIKEMGQAN